MAMANLFHKRVKACIMTIDEVPPKWRKQVEKLLKEEEQ